MRVLDNGNVVECWGIVGCVASVQGADKSITRLHSCTQPHTSIRAGNVLEPGICNKWGPFDAIHVGAAADTLPRVLVEQLQPGGRMVIPVGPRNDYQVLQVVDKGTGDEEAVRVEHLFYVRYVPLTHPHEGT